MGRIEGWAVMDTTTGAVRRLAAPPARQLSDTLADLRFSGDSRYLLTNENARGPRSDRGHRFVAYDVRDGSARVLEQPGRSWLPNPGSADSGVVWARGRSVFRVDPATGERSVVRLEEPVVDASWGPDDRAFAWISRSATDPERPWRLHAGPTLGEARDRVVRLDPDPGQLLGWRDGRHVVVGHFRRDVQVVDVVTGEVERIDLAGYGEPINAPLLAGALWRQPLREPAPPVGRTDPRAPLRDGAAYALVGVGVGLLVLRRRQESA